MSEVPSGLIVVGILIVAISVFTAIGVDNSTPMFSRTEFDDICSHYLAVIEKDSGLTTSQKNQLVIELNAIGIIDVAVTAPLPSPGNWGTKGKLVVTGNYSYTTIDPSGNSYSTKTIPVKYEMGTMILSLTN